MLKYWNAKTDIHPRRLAKLVNTCARIVGGHILVLVVSVVLLSNYSLHAYKNQRIAELSAQNKVKQQNLHKLALLVFGKSIHLDDLIAVKVTVSSYNPVRAQGWGAGFTTNDGNLAIPGVVALSHDLFEEYGLKHGQIVMVKGYGAFKVADKMHHRFTRRVDIISFIPEWSKRFGIKTSILYFAKEAISE